MNRLKRILQDLRREVAQLDDHAGPAPGEIDLRRLDDRELARLERLLRRAEGRPVPTGEVTYPSPANRRYYEASGREPPEEWQEMADPEPLSEAEQDELEALLEKASVPEPWQGGAP